MLVIESYGKNIYINDLHVGYIGRNELYIKGKKFADITDEGIISQNGVEVGYVDDDSYIIIRDKEVGYIDINNNFVFDKPSDMKL